MKVNNTKYKTIWSEKSGRIMIIDQTYLPFKFKITELTSIESAIEAIFKMKVRGAPLIGVTAAYGLYLSIKKSPSDECIEETCDKLMSTRPTAINLKWALDFMKKELKDLPFLEREKKAFDLAEEIANRDEKINEKIGENGLQIIQELYKNKNQTINILTHCNAGWLATVDWGTATAPIYKARDSNIPIHVWVDETRPRNQGSYLTSWELKHEDINHTIIADNAGGHLMRKGMIDLVITGSDRTTYKGDVCNKIGTYLKALAAYDNNIPFYVSIPHSTIDWDTSDSNEIVIEERNDEEVHFIEGLDKDRKISRIRITPEETNAANFAFDVTPNKFITGLITEFGVFGANESDIMKIRDLKL